MIDFLNELNDNTSFDSQAFYNTMSWLSNRKFYLTKEECDKINSLKEEKIIPYFITNYV